MAYELRDFSDIAPATTVASDITNVSTTIAITNGTGYPSGGASGDFMIQIDSEIIRCSSRSTNTLTVSGGVAGRGQNGTTAVSHVAGGVVNHVCTATNDAKEANRAVAKTIGVATTSQDMLVADSANSFTRLAIGTNGTVLQALAGAVAYAALPANSVGASQITDGTVGSAELASGAVTAGKIAAGGVSASNQFAAGVVDTTALGASAVTSAKILDGTIATADIANSAITTALIADANVTTPKLADGNVTQAKLETAQQFEAGDLKTSARSAASTGWQLCDGTALNRTTFATLFAAIGTSYGVGDGSTTFNVPDYRGKTIIGAGTGSGLTARSRGDTGGEETHILTLGELASHSHTHNAHNHGITDPGHTHGTGQAIFGGGLVAFTSGGNAFITTTTSSTTGISINNATSTAGTAGSGNSHNNMQPYGVANVFIKT